MDSNDGLSIKVDFLKEINTQWPLDLGKRELRPDAIKFLKTLNMIDESRLKWDLRFLDLAKFISSWSKDPSTKTGAVIIDSDNRIISVGYNGFPKGVDDSEERYNNRELKYKIVVHCERNALLFANRNCKYCTLYTWPFMSCSVCASMVIQSGITRCVAPEIPDSLKERWREDTELSTQLFKEAGVQLVLLKDLNA